MNRTEVAALLAYVAAHDRRTLGDADVEAWFDVLHDEPFAAARSAAAAHFRDGFGWLNAAEVRQRIRRARNDRAARAEVRAIAERVGTPRAAEHAEQVYRAQGWPLARRAALAHVCPWCLALPGAACVAPAHATDATPGGRVRLTGVHPTRLTLTVACPACGAQLGQRCDCPERDRLVRSSRHLPPETRSRLAADHRTPLAGWAGGTDPSTAASDANGRAEPADTAQPSPAVPGGGSGVAQ